MAQKVIDIPGYGEVEFPETMSDSEIAAQAARLYREQNLPPAAQCQVAQAVKRGPPFRELAQELGLSGMLGAVDLATGVGKEAERFVHTGGEALRNAPVIGTPISALQQALPKITYPRPSPPSNLMQQIGSTAAQVGDYYLPGRTVGALTKAVEGAPALAQLATRAGLGAASTGGIAALQGSDPGQAALLGAVSPVAGAVAARAGKAALANPELVKDLLPVGLGAE